MELEGMNLGEKHRNHNKTVKSRIQEAGYQLDEFDVDEGDVSNLIKIDLASETRNLEYILKVLVCNDLLYVSRAIKKCKWLITEQEYAHIINVKYLQSELFKQMNTRAVNKLKKSLKLHLKDPARVESFYVCENDPAKAVKWLPNCSTHFIEQNIHKHINHLNMSLLKRLCEKTIKVLDIFLNNYEGYEYSKKTVLEATMFLLNIDMNKYLDMVEEISYERPDFGKRATAYIMKKAPQRIIDKYELYHECIHLETFIKCLGSKNIKNFLFQQASKRESSSPAIFNRNSLQMFVENMPEEERFDFINKLFIDKIHERENTLPDGDKRAMTFIYDCAEDCRYGHDFLWFHVPFHTCFEHMKKSLQSEPRSRDATQIISTIIIKARENQEDLNNLMLYFQKNNTSFEIKDIFIRDVTTYTNFHRFDQITWNIMENLMMDKNGDYNELYEETVSLYKLLNGRELPDIIYKYVNTLKNYRYKLNEQEQNKLYEFLYNHFTKKLTSKLNLNTTLEEFEETIDALDECLVLLKDFDKNLSDDPFLIESIHSLVKIRKQNQWTTDMSSVYNKDNSWKKCLFHISFELYPSECVLINAIKHDAMMLQQYQEDLDDLRFNDQIKLTRFLKKIRIYWSTSIAKEWTEAYLRNVNTLNGQKASALGICILLPRMELQKILYEYAPEAAKIDYNNFDELKLNMQRNFAKIMHHARPQQTFQTILLFAKGDYLQYALPALLSMFHNLSCDEGHKQILEVIDTRVSLQKHAIRLAFLKLNTTDLSNIFIKIWETTKNFTLRTVLFKSVHDILCKENDHLKINQLWMLLESFIDNLNFNENKIIYDLLLQVKNVHVNTRANYFTKSYYFLKKLAASDVKYNSLSDEIDKNLVFYVREIIELLPSQVVNDIVIEFIDREFKTEKTHHYNFREKTEIISAYLLCAKDESTQIQRYDDILRPIIQYSCVLWKKGEHYMRNNLELLLKQLRADLNYSIVEKKMIVPIKMFEMIQRDLDELFDISENYYMLTKWKLTVAFASSLNGQQICEWKELCQNVAQRFIELCHKYLKENCKTLFPRVYILFSNSLKCIIEDIEIDNISWDIFNGLVVDKEFVEGYLAALKLYPGYIDDEYEEKAKKLRQIIFDHPSAEVKMHYYEKFTKEIS